MNNDLISRKEIVDMIDKLYDDFCNSEGGESSCTIDGNTYHSDMGYAFEGIEMFIEVFKKRLAESEKGDTE